MSPQALSSFSRRDGKEVYYRASDSVQASALHHVIEHVAEIACPE